MTNSPGPIVVVPDGQEHQNAPGERPWYGRTWVIVIALLLFWPLGLILMWKRTCTWSRVAKIIVTILVALAFMGSLGDATDTVDLSSTLSSNETLAASSSYIDAYDNVSVCALLDAKGSQLEDLFEGKGYSWNDGYSGWLRRSDGAALVVYNGRGTSLSEDAVDDLAAGGGSEPTVYLLSVAGYKGALPALKGATLCTINHSAQVGEYAYGIVTSPAGRKAFIVSIPEEDGTYSLVTYNEAAVKSGMLKTSAGISGNTMDEAWASLQQLGGFQESSPVSGSGSSNASSGSNGITHVPANQFREQKPQK